MSDPAFQVRLRGIFSRVFGITLDRLPSTIDTETIAAWDSLAHLALIAELEKEFRTRFSTSESVNMLSESAIARALAMKLHN